MNEQNNIKDSAFITNLFLKAMNNNEENLTDLKSYLAEAPKGEINKFLDDNACKLLILAVRKESDKVVGFLLSVMNPEWINYEDKYGVTVLHYAASMENKEVVKLLLSEKRFNAINKFDKQGRTALYVAISTGHGETAKLLLSKMSIDAINKWDKDGYTILHEAVDKGHEGIVKLLLSEKRFKGLNHQDKEGMNVLHIAAFKGHIGIVKLLLSDNRFEGLNHFDINGHTVLMFLMSGLEARNEQIFKLLLSKMSIDGINKAGKSGKTALHLAVDRGYEEIVKLLLSKMTQGGINHEDNYGMTVLYIAVSKGHKKIFKLLLSEMSIDGINKADKSGKTVLHYAAKEGKDDFVKLLIESGKCDLNVKDDNNNDIWKYYPAKKGGEITDLLIKYGAKYPAQIANNIKDFVIDSPKLLTVVAQSLEYEKQYNLVKKIIHQLELTSLEAQKVASKIYKILKETESNKNTINGYNKPWRFSDIVVCYKGKNNNLIEDNNIKEFCRNLDSKSLSQEIYRNILKEKISEDGKIVYGIHTDPQTKHIYTDLLLHSNKYNQDGDHGQDDDHKNDIYNNKEEVKNGGKDNQIDSSSKNNAQINKADNGQILYDYESNLSGLDAEVNPQDIIYYKQ